MTNRSPFRFPFLILAVLAAAAAGLVACAGQAARDRAQLPAISQTWSSVRIEIARQLQRSPDPGGMQQLLAADDAIAEGSATKIAVVSWKQLEQLADQDTDARVAAGEIGPLVGEALRARAAELVQSVNQYLRAPQ